VASARAEAERRAEIPHANKRVDAKSRRQPAKKKPRRVTTISLSAKSGISAASIFR
jgi:hypothetical protein